jgi:glutathione S-transferase
MPITVHHLNNSRSQRVLWLLEELGIPYEIEKYQRQADKRAPESLKAVHPLGKSPVITDGSVTLAESGAIVDYLIRKYGDGKASPRGDEWVNESLWSHFAEGEIISASKVKSVIDILLKSSKAPSCQ